MVPDALIVPLLAAAEPASAKAAATAVAAEAYADPGRMPGPLYAAVVIGLVSISVGMVLCLYRLWKGPRLADRVLASDVFALHVVAFVILLSVYLRDLTFFDAALGVSIVGFASTVGFAQYIGARNGRASDADTPRAARGAAPAGGPSS